MKRNMKSFVLAYLSDVDIDYIVDMHIAYHCDFEGKPKPQRAILKQKYQYMLHLIITKCKYAKDSICHLNAEFYRDHIFYQMSTRQKSVLWIGILAIELPPIRIS